MITVKARDDEHIDKLLRRFKKKVDASGILKEVRKKEHYVKPSERKKKKRAAAQKRRRRSAARIKKRR